MAQFWLMAGLLLLVALLFVVLPLLLTRLKKGSAQGAQALNAALYQERLQSLEQDFQRGALELDAYQALKQETQRALLSDYESEKGLGDEQPLRSGGAWLPILAAALLVPLCLALYHHLGAAGELALQQSLQASRANLPQSEAEMLTWVQEREAALGPNASSESLHLLARSYQSLKAYTEAERIYQRLLTQETDKAPVLAELSSLRFFATNDPLDSALGRYIDQALQLDPEHVSVLGLAGVRAYEMGAYSEAIERWQKALSLLTEPDGPEAKALQAGIERAKQALALP